MRIIATGAPAEVYRVLEDRAGFATVAQLPAARAGQTTSAKRWPTPRWPRPFHERF